MVTTRVCEQLGCANPVFGFSWWEPDVAIAVSQAGGLGIWGCTRRTPEEIESGISRMKAELGDLPWGVDLVIPAGMPDSDDRSAIEATLPEEHVAFVEYLRENYDVPDYGLPVFRSRFVRSEETARQQLSVVMDHRIPVLALGIGSPAWAVEAAHEQGSLIVSLVGAPTHAESAIRAGADLLVAQGTDAGGHTGPIGTFSLVPQVVAVAGGRPVLAAGGVATGRHLAAALALQVSERLAQRAALNSLSGALDSAPSALAFFDANQRLAFWNAPYAQLMGPYEIELRRGLEMAELGRALAHTEALATWAGGAPLTPETLRRMRERGTFVNSAGRAFRMDLGSPPGGGMVVVIHDVTAQQQAAEALVRARDAAEAASRAKSEFLANMSHEVRTPLNAVLGMAQIMARHPLDEDQKERLSVIRESGATLLTLLDAVLDISKLEAGGLGLDIRDFDLCARLGSACAPFALEAEAKGLGFDLHVDPGLDGAWRGDGARIAQVVSNLVSNAVKFTDAGQVTVSAEPAEGGVRITVRDTGIGMDEHKLAHLYEAFAQGDGSSTRRFGGAGLGLAMARRLSDLMGATLSARSRPAEGSVFILDLPLARAPEAAPAAAGGSAAEDEGRPMRILAAEDNATNRRVLSALMEPLGVELTLAADGAEAVEAFSAGAFDLVLMDIQMPRLSGVEATRAIREIELRSAAPRTPIVAVTANVMSHQIEEYLAAGMDAVVPKPLQAEALLQAILRAAEPPALAVA